MTDVRTQILLRTSCWFSTYGWKEYDVCTEVEFTLKSAPVAAVWLPSSSSVSWTGKQCCTDVKTSRNVEATAKVVRFFWFSAVESLGAVTEVM